MAAVLNRSTLQYLASANTPDYPEPAWIINPDMGAVVGVAQKYWKLVGDTPQPMDRAERDAIDAASLTAQRAAAVAQLQQTEDVLRAFMLIVMDEFNTHAQRVNALLTAIDNGSTLTNIKTAVAAIADIPIRIEQQLRDAILARLGT